MKKTAPILASVALTLAFTNSASAQAPFTRIADPSGVTAVVDSKYAANSQWWLSGLHFVDLDADGLIAVFIGFLLRRRSR